MIFLHDITGAASKLDRLKSDYKSPNNGGSASKGSSPNGTLDARRSKAAFPINLVALKLEKSRKASDKYSSPREDPGSDSGRIEFQQPRVSIQDPTLNNNQFKKEIEKRLQDIKEPTVLDFGIEDHSLWDQITGHKDHQLQLLQNKEDAPVDAVAEDEVAKAKPPSLWWIIYDCISKYPKFE